MELAISLSGRSTCGRKKVGCVIASEDYSNIFGIGYNGSAKGMKNGCDSQTPGDCGCLHAEDNALLKVNEGSYIPKVAFVSLAPCKYCAKRFINKGGFKKIFYFENYRKADGIKLLDEAGITTLNFQDYFKR